MKKNSEIKAYWYHDVPNFGDLLNPYLIANLFNKRLRYKHYYTVRFYIRVFISNLKRTNKLKLPKKALLTLPWQKVLFGIGSILDYSNNKTIVWGSGFRNSNSNFLIGKPTKIIAVRGEHTLSRLNEIGYKTDKDIAIGDPAILLPLAYPNLNKIKKFRVGIIPHYLDYDFFFENYEMNYKIINPLNVDVENVINSINSCEYILSSSLHGIIVAHAYNIPAIWIKKGDIGTSSFKFHDYFSSVGIKPYEGFLDLNKLLDNHNSIIDLFNANSEIHSIKKDKRIIQNRLIEAFEKCFECN